ncbi:hypothetical protein PPROV_000015400 [Pycnococcus provasolii]|uniref:Peptidase S9 prolyl oligopeptidase catalytic domain-containing protein n=3 Tax=Pycnococcus provasolii TaxID=41880 RepID=A0A830H460_9CHLO|nr:hypothetical protein PPROV_000015400 [Pycnococcus provasolii]
MHSALLTLLKRATYAPGTRRRRRTAANAQDGSSPTSPSNHMETINIPALDPLIASRLDAYQNTRSASVLGFGSEQVFGGGLLIATRFAETSQVHHVKSPLAMRRQLTFAREPIKAFTQPPPNTKCRQGFVTGSDVGGDEQIQFTFHDALTGRTRLLTDGASQNRSAKFEAPNGTRIAFSSNVRRTDLFDIYVVDAPMHEPDDTWVQPPTRRRIVTWTEPGYLFISDFASSTLLMRHYTSVSESVFYLVNADKDEQQQPTRVWPPKGTTASVKCGRLWTDVSGRVTGVIFASDEGGEFATLRYYDIASQKTKELISAEQVPWDVEDIELLSFGHKVGGLVVVAYNEDGASTLHTFVVDGESPAALTNVTLNRMHLPESLGELGSMHLRRNTSDEQKGVATLAFGFISATSPTDAFTMQLNEDGEQCAEESMVRWTDSEVGGLDKRTFVAPELVRIKSFDGLTISGYLYKPPRATSTTPCPVIVHPHGGPEGQHRPGFASLYQYLCVELGVAVLDPNVRGSDGYGKTFVTLDDGYKREDSVKDLGAFLDWICTKDDLDAKRVAVWGGSYGGYMSLAALVHYGDRLRCGISMVGITNFVTFLENTSAYRRDLRRCKYGDERIPEMREFLQRISPLTSAHKIRCPVFLAQGARDPRVPVSEARQMREAMSNDASDKWFMVAPNEGHGFRRKGNRDAYQMALVQFLQEHLL